MPVALSMYQLSVGIHVVFVVSFLATAGSFSVLGPMAKENPQHVVFALKVEEKIYKTLIFPGILVVWGTGIYQTQDAGYNLGDDLWLTISIVLFAIMTLLALAVNYPSVKTALTEIEGQTEPGPPSPAAQAALGKLAKTGPLMGIMFLVIAFLMGAQPF